MTNIYATATSTFNRMSGFEQNPPEHIANLMSCDALDEGWWGLEPLPERIWTAAYLRQ